MSTHSSKENFPARLTLLVLAAGMGSRFGGLKQMTALGPSGETVLEYSVFDAIRAGFDKVVFVIRRDFDADFREKVGRKFEGKIEVEYAFQDLEDLPEPFRTPAGRSKPWGTAHAVWAARKVVHSPFAVINADDFYGADAYRKLASFLPSSKSGRKPARFCLIAYKLGRTLSENGTVSRGVCSVDKRGFLESIVEREKIRASENGPQFFNGTEWESLPFDTPVSMNMMGFTPDLFLMLEERFRLFLEKRIEEPGVECYLPESVAFAIARGQADVTVVETSGDWMGITYSEDKERFSKSVRKLHEKGEYPRCLWQ